MKDITKRFSLGQLDHYELLDLFELRYQTAWRVSDSEITFPAQRDYSLRVRLDQGRITQIIRGPKLSKQDIDGLLEQVDINLEDARIAEYGVEILLARRPVVGGFRCESVPLQILPPPVTAPRTPQVHADHPFTLEYPIRASRAPEFRLDRRRRGAVEWARVLNALLVDGIKYQGTRPRQLWATKVGDIGAGCFWAEEFYIVEGQQGFVSSLSPLVKPLPLVPRDSYFADWPQAGVPQDELTLPDNLDQLLAAFVGLNTDRRRRFLRAATAIYVADEVWNVSVSNHLLACVQAIEALIEHRVQGNIFWIFRQRSPGPMRMFREFCAQHGNPMKTDKKTLNALYEVRSNLTHGRYLFQLDEAPWASSMGLTIANIGEQDSSSAALTLAKTVLRNWLLASSPNLGTAY